MRPVCFETEPKLKNRTELKIFLNLANFDFGKKKNLIFLVTGLYKRIIFSIVFCLMRAKTGFKKTGSGNKLFKTRFKIQKEKSMIKTGDQ